jgi:aldehyde dehydrogenase (NAD+)
LPCSLIVKSQALEIFRTLRPREVYTNRLSDESVIASVYAASEHDIDTAVRAARNAFEDASWSGISPTDRGNLMLKLSQLIEENTQTLAAIETWNNGKPYSVSLGEDVPATAAVIKYYAGYADKIHGQVLGTGPAKFAYTVREPIGVCGQIIP